MFVQGNAEKRELFNIEQEKYSKVTKHNPISKDFSKSKFDGALFLSEAV